MDANLQPEIIYPIKRRIHIPSVTMTQALLRKIHHERLNGYQLGRLCEGRITERAIYRWLQDTEKHTLDMRSVDVLMGALGMTLSNGLSRFKDNRKRVYRLGGAPKGAAGSQQKQPA